MARDLSVYVHLPFCLRKCHYCDFNSRPAAESERARYLAALKLEIQRRAELLGASHIRTIFLGGGTPTIYHGEELAGLLEMLKDTAASPPPAPRMPETGGSAGVRTTNGMGRGGTSRFAGPSPVPPSGGTGSGGPSYGNLLPLSVAYVMSSPQKVSSPPWRSHASTLRIYRRVHLI